MDLIWENASPTSNFASQTIALNLSNYWGVVIVFYRSAGNHQHFVDFVKKNEGQRFLQYVGRDSLEQRIVTVSNDGLLFNDGEKTAYNGTWTNSNDLSIPYQIYGLSGIT